MLMPKRTKFRKMHKGRNRGMATSGTTISFGDYGLMACSAGWLSSRQIEATRIAITRHMKRVKDFKLNENGQGGKWANFRDGSVNWPEVRKELDKLGKDMWMTIEGSGGLSLEEKSKRLDLIAQGK